jgi:glycosyltransferase involved in cell wall biosynthesis
MLSIGIPTFNFNVTHLVGKLYHQIEKLNLPIEIIVLDDGSSEEFRKINREISQLPHIKYIEQSNQGRSATRNKLATFAQQPYILYIDCDCDVYDDYLSKYITQLQKNTVLVGGLRYPPLPADKRLYLRWKVGQQKEVKSLKTRKKFPYANFLSSNFSIPVRYIIENGFDRELLHYGHEDTMFGNWLNNNKIKIHHIDNPVIHLGMETAEQYLKKVRESIFNALVIYKKNPQNNTIKLFKYYRILKKIRMDGYFCTIFESLRLKIEDSLCSDRVSLILLDIYKLGIFCTLIHKKHTL